MKKVLMILIMMFMMILISCELSKDETDDGVSPTDETIEVTTPASGDTLTVGESFKIKWTSNSDKNVKIQFTSDNGKNWITIISNYENVESYLWAPVPNNISDQCRVKIFTTDSTVSAVSQGFFSIVEPLAKTIKLNSPNGGEVLLVDGEFDIKWTSTSVDLVKLEYSIDKGSNWTSIVENYPADSGKYTWKPIPNRTSLQSLIRIKDVAADTVFDVSDNVFVISVPKTIKVVQPNGGEKWIGNTSQTITWFSSEVANVKIEYTLDNGVNWKVLTESTISDGYYTWDPIPNSPSANAKIKISDISGGYPSDVSDAVFSIEPEQFITVVSPNGNEEWLSGSGHYIKWNTSTPGTVPNGSIKKSITSADKFSAASKKSTDKSTNKISNNVVDGVKSTTSLGGGNGVKSITDVKIEYSTNNGGTWFTITESTPNNGNFLWNPIPVHNSVLCVVRVSDALDGVPFDISDVSFTIVQNPTVDIVVVQPNGGEEWNSGTTQTIKWTSKGIASVDLEYSTNNGVNWKTIENNVPSSGYYTWSQVPNTASNNCKIRISNSNIGVPFDESNGSFSILPEPGITVITPNGGETLQTGSSTNITWTSENIDRVRIELTTNNGASWSSIASSTESDGNFTWTTIPDLNSSLCKVKISDANDGIPSDISDKVFVITNQIEQTIEVKIPNNGEVWEANTSKLIQWASNGVDSVKIDFSSNNGITWSEIVNNLENTGSYDWTVPNINSTQAKIRIRDNKDNDPSDESNGTFIIRQAGSLKILKPASGDVILSGESTKIEWEAKNVEKVKIEFTMTDAIYDPDADFFDDDWSTLMEDAPGAAGFFEHRFTSASNLYRIRISDAQLGSPVDFSGLFTVKARPVKSINVESPNGAEKLFAGSSYSIRWSSSSIEYVDILLSTNNGATWQPIADDTESDGVYTWNSVPNVSSSLCKIRIVDSANDQFYDESNENFEIIYQNEIVMVTSPNGNEVWNAGTTQDITWQTTGIENVKIQITTNNGIEWIPIVESTPSDGHYTWNQVTTNASTNCKIKISDAKDGMPSDDSDNFFTIAPEPGIKVLSPNGGENFVTGTSVTVSWTAVNVENVKIEYTTNGGAKWNVITPSVASTGSYKWENIPDLNSDLCQIKVSDASDGSPYDISDSYFRITNKIEQSLTVLKPNGNEEYEAGTTQNISWTGSNVPIVDVEYSTNNGTSWIALSTGLMNSGAVEWSIPVSINSPQCKIRVRDAQDGIPTDESDGVFTIKPAQSIKVITPVGGDVIKSGDGINITWTATGIENVGIRYTTTNGLGSLTEPAFYEITSSAPNTGEYFTSFSIPSSRYYIEVYDAKDGAPRSRSLGNFTVLQQVTNSITVNSPNGGENLLIGERHEIKWKSVGVERVNIDVSTNGGATWSSIISNLTSNGMYNWTAGNLENGSKISVKSENCKIRITDFNSISIFDETDGYFSLHPNSKHLRVVSPNGGEEWDYDNGQLILWETSGIEFVNIYFSYNNGTTWTSIANKYPSNGAFEWDPPKVATNLGRIKIVEYTTQVAPALNQDTLAIDISDSYFRLDNLDVIFRPFVTILNPNSSAVLTAGSLYNIVWNNSQDIVKVNIQYSANNGSTWTDVVLDYTETPWDKSNSYSWTVPILPTKTGRIRIIGFDSNGLLSAQSITDVFEIK
ncbi:MAG: hypothetical protein KKB34_09200 [Bacteroidetes bacterium]|nr:hypothetical protein [Bacteroidota bacterium]